METGTRKGETMVIGELTKLVLDRERYLAPGSRTLLLGDYNERMRVLAFAAPQPLPVADDWDNPSDAVVISQDEADWWLGAYTLFEANPEPENLHHDIYYRVDDYLDRAAADS